VDPRNRLRLARTLPIRFLSEERAGGIYDTQDVGLDDDCWACLWIRGDALRDDAHCRSDRSFLFPKSRDVKTLGSQNSPRLGKYESQVLCYLEFLNRRDF
jgi:hypothetical protein